MCVGKRIKERRKNLGMSAEDVASIIGVSPATVYRYESGGIESMRTDKLVPIAKALCTTPAFLMGWTEDPTPSAASFFESYPSALPVSTRRVPILGGAACGEPVYEPGDGTEYTTVEGDMPCDFALIAQGDSMTGDRIYSGDVVYFVHADDVPDGQIAAVAVDDGVSIKRIKRLRAADGSVLFTQLLSSNPAFNSIDIGGPDETRIVNIIGRAVAFKGKLNQ